MEAKPMTVYAYPISTANADYAILLGHDTAPPPGYTLDTPPPPMDGHTVEWVDGAWTQVPIPEPLEDETLDPTT